MLSADDIVRSPRFSSGPVARWQARSVRRGEAVHRLRPPTTLSELDAVRIFVLKATTYLVAVFSVPNVIVFEKTHNQKLLPTI